MVSNRICVKGYSCHGNPHQSLDDRTRVVPFVTYSPPTMREGSAHRWGVVSAARMKPKTNKQVYDVVHRWYWRHQAWESRPNVAVKDEE